MKAIWISRDLCSVFFPTNYDVWNKKPHKYPDDYGFYYELAAQLFIGGYEPEQFEKMTGYTLLPGERKRVEIKVKECRK